MDEDFVNETKKWRQEVDARLNAGGDRMTAIETRIETVASVVNRNTVALSENTALTKQCVTDVAGINAGVGGLLEAWNAARGGFKVLEQLGKLTKGIAVLAVIGGVIAVAIAKVKAWVGL